MHADMTRRDVIKTGGALLLAGIAGAAGSGAAAAQQSVASAAANPRKRALRFAHLTDSHIQPERKADQGTIACLRHVMAQKDRPELLITGGDLIMDSFEADFERTKLQWDLFTRVFKDECGIPVKHCLGNHDIWGWNKQKSKVTGDEPQYGKKWAVDVLGLERPYHAFDHGGWHGIILDSVAPGPDGNGYIGKLDAQQLDWLIEDLQKTPKTTPIFIVSHIPILAACVYFGGNRAEETRGNWQVSAGVMHLDARTLMELFQKHTNVKLCLSGHIHELDRVDYRGVTYICDGAVSGAWWRGKNRGFAEGYGVIDLFDDGTFDHQYATYGWEAKE